MQQQYAERDQEQVRNYPGSSQATASRLPDMHLPTPPFFREPLVQPPAQANYSAPEQYTYRAPTPAPPVVEAPIRPHVEAAVAETQPISHNLGSVFGLPPAVSEVAVTPGHWFPQAPQPSTPTSAQQQHAAPPTHALAPPLVASSTSSSPFPGIAPSSFAASPAPTTALPAHQQAQYPQYSAVAATQVSGSNPPLGVTDPNPPLGIVDPNPPLGYSQYPHAPIAQNMQITPGDPLLPTDPVQLANYLSNFVNEQQAQPIVPPAQLPALAPGQRITAPPSRHSKSVARQAMTMVMVVVIPAASGIGLAFAAIQTFVK